MALGRLRVETGALVAQMFLAGVRDRVEEVWYVVDQRLQGQTL
jgi:hypothetical protein